jgi:hypothetical protein
MNEAMAEHRRAWDAIPWVINDSATAQQRAEVEGHIARCSDCAAEFQRQQRVQQALALQPTPALDTEAGLESLLARIDAPAAVAPARRPSRLPMALAAAVAVQAVALGLLSLKLWSGEDGYRTYTQPPVADTPAAVLRVVPDATMRLQDWNTLLRTSGLTVVDGPNAAGAYTLASGSGTSSVPELLARLRATPGVQLAEPVGGNR